MPSELERAMEALISVFHRYASHEGEQYKLSRGEFRTLMETELSSFLKHQKDPDTVNRITDELDSNVDGQLDFEEFVSLVVGLTIACEQCYVAHSKLQ